VFGLPYLSPRDLITGAAALVRAGVIRPLVPSRSLLGRAIELPLMRPNLGVAIAWQAATQPQAAAVIDDVGTLSWAELDRRVNRLSQVLLEYGEEDGCVAFMLRNGREAVECYAAGGRSGLVPVPLNTSATGSEVARILHMQRPSVLIVDTEFDEIVSHALRDLQSPPKVITVGTHGQYESLLSTASSVAPLRRGTARIVVHTSGTNGTPKAAERQMGPAQVGALLGFLRKVPLQRGDRLLLGPPLFHAFASGVVGAACVVGVTSILPRTFEAPTFGRIVREHDVSATALVPTMLRRVLACDEPPGATPLRIVLSSGSTLGAVLRDKVEDRWGKVLYDVYGSTEAGWVAIANPDEAAERAGTVGRPGPGMQVKVLDPSGAARPTGQIGTLHVATGIEFNGYTGSDPRPRPTPGSWDMGDLGYVDDDGYVYVTGRRDEMIVSGGENVYPAEIEGLLETCPDVIESAVVGMEHDDYQQVLWAYVVGEVNPDQVMAWLRPRLSAHKVPKRVVVLDELPRNAMGKVAKRKLMQSEHPSRRPATT
jgi:acyl-CoA synthetase (AMP-forming)/AMP-acid ligase II